MGSDEETPATIEQTTGESSLPPMPSVVTIDPDSSADPAPSSVVDTPGLPPPDSSILRKKIGQDAGVSTGEEDTLVFSFHVVEIDPAFGPRCNGSQDSTNGHLIGVKIAFEVLDAYDPARDIPLGFQSDWFGTRAADGTTYEKLGTDAAAACLTKSLLPQEDLAKGDSGTGWIVLDSPIRYGTVTFTQTDLDGGWEWVIPGS